VNLETLKLFLVKIVVNNFTYPYIVVNKREELMLLEAAMSD